LFLWSLVGTHEPDAKPPSPTGLDQKRSTTMNEQDFQNKLGELMQQIGELPTDQRERLEQMAGEARDRHNRMKKTITDLQDSLDYLRLSVKYIMFDLEATRRENAYLRKLLEKSAEGHDDGNGAD
jgi:chromosome segregation ATPase